MTSQQKKEEMEISPLVPSPCFPTEPFAILEPQNQSIRELYAVRKSRSTHFLRPKIVIVPVGLLLLRQQGQLPDRIFHNFAASISVVRRS